MGTQPENRRLEISASFKSLLGSNEVYFQAPENIKMQYPAIVYRLSRIKSRYADDKRYLYNPGYETILITKKPNDPLVDGILNTFVKCSFVGHYVADNLHHYKFIIY